MAKQYRAGELYNGGGNPAVYLASDYDTLAADKADLLRVLGVADARVKALEAELAFQKDLLSGVPQAELFSAGNGG